MCSDAEEIVFCGCGSAFNVSHAVAPFFQGAAGKTCRAVHASDLVINPGLFVNRARRTLAVLYSRSGDTTESVLALRAARSLGCPTIAVTCFRRSAMAGEADAVLLLDGAVEKSVTTTRSLTSMVLAGYALAGLNEAGAARIGPDLAKLPGICRKRMERFEEIGKRVSEDGDIVKYAFLGTGSRYGLAREAQLKIKEMVLLPSDSYVSLDFRHGPMSNVDGGMLVTMLTSDAGLAYDREIANDMKALGGKVFVLCDEDRGGFAGAADYLFEVRLKELGCALSEGVWDILYMPALQFMAYYKSLAVGCDPDNPKNLFYYVTVN
jgi:glucosamine--fructose-6-phosphate aminotransferase (isomerizing)